MLDDVDQSPPLFQFGSFSFDSLTGELQRVDGAPGNPVERLPPQPSRLLEILVARQGELVTREEIRQALWPETHVDFDQSLRFCVRQIRTALGDSASEKTYIETLPRRGYRFLKSVAAIERSPRNGQDRGPARPRPGASAWLAGGSLVLALLAVGAWLDSGASRPAPVRLAIMPFELAATDATEPNDLARMSEWLVAEFASGWAGSVEVIGPRSTAAYSAFPFPDMDRLARDLEADYVLNARFMEHQGRLDFLVELIRLRDGAHPWAEFFAEPSSWRAVAETARDRSAEALALPPRSQ